MDHNKIYMLFLNVIPIPEEEVIDFQPIGKNTISIRLTSGYSFIFRTTDDKKWILQPNTDGRYF